MKSKNDYLTLCPSCGERAFEDLPELETCLSCGYSPNKQTQWDAIKDFFSQYIPVINQNLSYEGAY
jgi:ribosomal protein L37E